MVWDHRQSDLVCTDCGFAWHCTHLEYDPPRHVNGTLLKQIGPQKYQRANHLRKWIGRVDQRLLQRYDKTSSELERIAMEHVLLFERSSVVRGPCKNVNYSFLLRRIMVDIMGIRDEEIPLKKIKNKGRLKACSALWDRLCKARDQAVADPVRHTYTVLGKKTHWVKSIRNPLDPKEWYKDLEKRVPWVKTTRIKLNKIK